MHPKGRFNACYRAVRSRCHRYGLTNEVLIALVLMYYVLSDEDLRELCHSPCDANQPCTQPVLVEERLDAKAEVTEAECLEVYAAARAAAYYVFKCKEVHGTSVDDIGNTAALLFLQVHSEVKSPKAWGRTVGYRRAIEVLTRGPNVVAMSVIAGDESWDTFIPAKNDLSESQFILEEFLESACGGKDSIDRKIVELKLDGNTYQEISEVLGMKQSTVRARFNKVLAKAEALNS